MPQIRPITDLRNTTEISDICHVKREPIIIRFYNKCWGQAVSLAPKEYL